jgi:hypothetical protein
MQVYGYIFLGSEMAVIAGERAKNIKTGSLEKFKI